MVSIFEIFGNKSEDKVNINQPLPSAKELRESNPFSKDKKRQEKLEELKKDIKEKLFSFKGKEKEYYFTSLPLWWYEPHDISIDNFKYLQELGYAVEISDTGRLIISWESDEKQS